MSVYPTDRGLTEAITIFGLIKILGDAVLVFTDF